MDQSIGIAALMVALITAFVGSVVPVGAQPRGENSPGGDMIYPGMMGPGMMGPGMMGRGSMGPGMMGPGTTSPSPQRPTGPLGAGEAIFRSQCAMCHTLQAGAPNSFGPNLHGLFGREAGSEPGYPYSPAMRRAGFVWDRASLDRFLADPQAAIPGTRMPYPGLADPQARHALESFLAQATR